MQFCSPFMGELPAKPGEGVQPPPPLRGPPPPLRGRREQTEIANFKIDGAADGIALITIDVPGRSLTTLTGQV
ncbi:MAG: hypothetical protein ACK5VL_01840, partial [Brevundimonas sp.]